MLFFRKKEKKVASQPVEKLEDSAPKLQVGPLFLYNDLLSSGVIVADDEQQGAVCALQSLFENLEQAPPVLKVDGDDVRWSHRGRTSPRGVYLYGDVGRGKSMLLELFFTSVTQPVRRVHFHEFMEELHSRMHQVKTHQGDPIAVISKSIAQECVVLCFDEFYITNIGDAMLLGRLLDALFARGVVVVITSNWAPDDLYLQGVNRVKFMPFIKVLLRYITPVSVLGDRDYRQWNNEDVDRLWVDVTKPDAHFILADLFKRYSGHACVSCEVSLKGSFLQAQGCENRVLWLNFKELCGKNLGREHYIALAHDFDYILLDEVPFFDDSNVDATLRFVALIDILYEQKKRMILGTPVAPESLCEKGDALFAYRRAVSRLAEMARW